MTDPIAAPPIDPERLARAMVGHGGTSPSHCNLDCARSIAREYAALSQPKEPNNEK